MPVFETCLMHGIIIDPDYQGKGIGIKLVNELLDYCALEEISPIRLLLTERDNRMRVFCERLGFSRSKYVIYDRTFES